MDPTNTILALQVIDSLLARAQVVGGTIAKAQKEGRDLTDAELDVLFAADTAKADELKAEIDQQRAEG